MFRKLYLRIRNQPVKLHHKHLGSHIPLGKLKILAERRGAGQHTGGLVPLPCCPMVFVLSCNRIPCVQSTSASKPLAFWIPLATKAINALHFLLQKEWGRDEKIPVMIFLLSNYVICSFATYSLIILLLTFSILNTESFSLIDLSSSFAQKIIELQPTAHHCCYY